MRENSEKKVKKRDPEVMGSSTDANDYVKVERVKVNIVQFFLLKFVIVVIQTVCFTSLWFLSSLAVIVKARTHGVSIVLIDFFGVYECVCVRGAIVLVRFAKCREKESKKQQKRASRKCLQRCLLVSWAEIQLKLCSQELTILLWFFCVCVEIHIKHNQIRAQF